MGLLPDIDEAGKVVEKKIPAQYTPPKNTRGCLVGEEALAVLNNLGHDRVTEDFSDSPHLNR